MSQRRVYHVRHDGDHWEVIREGFHRPHFVRGSKEEAVLIAKRLAKTSSPGLVVIHDSQDAIERRFAYDFSLDPQDTLQ